MIPVVENVVLPNSRIVVKITMERADRMVVVLRHDCHHFLCQLDVDLEQDPLWTVGYGAYARAGAFRRVRQLEVVRPCPSCSRRRRRRFVAGRVQGTSISSVKWTHACRGQRRAASLGIFDADKGVLDVRCRKCEHLQQVDQVSVSVPIDAAVQFALELVDQRLAEWIDEHMSVSPRK